MAEPTQKVGFLMLHITIIYICSITFQGKFWENSGFLKNKPNYNVLIFSNLIYYKNKYLKNYQFK